jgi:hypothetical protein
MKKPSVLKVRKILDVIILGGIALALIPGTPDVELNR